MLYSMPCRFKSYVYLCAPVTIACPLTLASDVPAVFQSPASLYEGAGTAVTGVSYTGASEQAANVAAALSADCLPLRAGQDGRDE